MGEVQSEAGAPSVLVLGTAHFAQVDYGFADAEFDRVTDALADYNPDLVAVEWLPPEWPPGRGRDYRPEFDLGIYADDWGLPLSQAEGLVERAADDSPVAEDPCELGRAYFLTRDQINALHLWDTHGCTDALADEPIAQWGTTCQPTRSCASPTPSRGPAAWRSWSASTTSQGQDAAWILYQEALTLEALLAPDDLWRMLPKVGPIARQSDAHLKAHDDDLVDLLRYFNSPQWIGVQYWVSEQQYPQIEVRNVGARQRDNYWLRNERMFAQLDEAVEERDAERVLVVVGLGHKYFLDELARENGYRWIDPRQYLPSQRYQHEDYPVTAALVQRDQPCDDGPGNRRVQHPG